MNNITKLDFRPLLASYGGGHAQMISRVALSLMARDIDINIIGFTTAYHFFKNQGIPAKSVKEIFNIDSSTNADYRELVQPFLEDNTHPHITHEETEAYFIIGLRDLVAEHGLENALELLKNNGRKAFCPESTMKRYLQQTKPDCVITTTSPRFELALLRAARALNIPSIAISDVYLVPELNWILEKTYADHLTVLSQDVKDTLILSGICGTTVHVTGNPVFDDLAQLNNQQSKRNQLRKKFKIHNEHLILWVATPRYADGNYATPNQVTIAFEHLCSQNKNYKYMIRPHPNDPFELPQNVSHGLLDMALTPEESLLIADIVCTEVSTMGLQAALINKPVICIGDFEDLAVYPKYGLATSVNTLQDAIDLIISEKNLLPKNLDRIPSLGTATETIVNIILETQK